MPRFVYRSCDVMFNNIILLSNLDAQRIIVFYSMCSHFSIIMISCTNQSHLSKTSLWSYGECECNFCKEIVIKSNLIANDIIVDSHDMTALTHISFMRYVCDLSSLRCQNIKLSKNGGRTRFPFLRLVGLLRVPRLEAFIPGTQNLKASQART